jgi:hypothetical protein
VARTARARAGVQIGNCVVYARKLDLVPHVPTGYGYAPLPPSGGVFVCAV